MEFMGLSMENKFTRDQLNVFRRFRDMKYVYKSSVDAFMKTYSEEEKLAVYSEFKLKMGDHFIESQ